MKEKSCGCIIIKDDKVLLVYENYSKFWGFPKGHVESGESEIETALREVKEEVGLDALIIKDKRYELHYKVNNNTTDKTTVLFLATTKDDKVQKQDREIGKYKWCGFDEAINTLAFDDPKELLNTAINDYKELAKEGKLL